jgi:hypothetical protein
VPAIRRSKLVELGWEAEGEERVRLWRMIVETDAAYQEYQDRISRRIPVVVLEPADLGAQSLGTNTQ